MPSVDQHLEKYLLARYYRWKQPKRDTGGALFLYPPIKMTGTGYHVLNLNRVESLHPDYVMGLIIDSDGNPRFLGKNMGQSA